MKKRGPSTEEQIAKGIFLVIGGIFRGIWWLVSWPWRGKGGKKVWKGRPSVSFDREMIGRRWQEIQEMVNLGGASRLRGAILEADNLLDYALKGKGLLGETMGERLKSARHLFTKDGYEAAWQGHKLRNRLVHELEVDILHWEVKSGIANFAKALRDLGVL